MDVALTLVAAGLGLVFVGVGGMTVRARGRLGARDAWLGPPWGSKLARLWEFIGRYRGQIGTDAWVWLLWVGLALFGTGILVSLALGRSAS